MALDNCFLYTKNDVLALSSSILHGYAIFENALVINTPGLNEFIRKYGGIIIPDEGRFCGVFIQGSNAVIKSDIHGQEIIYIYKKGEDWAVSNSFMLLATYASKVGRLNFYEPAALNFLLKNGTHIGEQLLSHKTMIEEIEIIPVNYEIHVDRLTGKIKTISKDFQNRFEITSECYEDTIISMLSRGMSLLETIVSSEQNLYLSLSGGYDSRLVLGMISRGLNDSKNVYIKSDVNRDNDFAIASQLCKKFDFSMNTFSPPRKTSALSASESLRMFILSCGGTYLPIYPVKSSDSNRKCILRLTGDYSADASFFRGRSVFNGNMRKIGADIQHYLADLDKTGQVTQDFLDTFDVLGVDIDSPTASVSYYSAIRSRHHCGRHWYKTMGSDYLMTPLMSKDFTSLNFLNYREGRSESKLFTDIFCALGTWATETPFESAKGNLDPNMVSNSKFNGGVRLDSISYEIFGSFRETQGHITNLYDLPVKFDFDERNFKGALIENYNKVDKTYSTRLFTDSDFERVKFEIDNDGKLSHGYRTLTHVLYVSLVKDLVEYSR
ncbi:hypothetical protein [Aeromonas veronii]|uniref:hypothetical protein n=1 Tax=Aeromonas veronii TaxID=654 RepID=UPI0031FC919A